MIVDVLLTAAAGIAALTAARFLRPAAGLVVSVVLGVLQVYLTTRFTVSLGAIWQLAAWVVVLRHRAALPRVRAVAVLYAALVLVSAVVLVWSPDRTAGMTLLAQLLGVGSTTCLVAIVVRRGEGGLRPAALVLAGLVALWAGSTVLFRVLPALENAYFVSPLFGGLNGQDLAAHFFTTQRNNVLDKTKSGGLFFVNANAASLFGGAAAVVLGARAALDRGLPRVVLAVAAVLALVGTVATGSKTAVYLSAAACLAVAVVVGVLWRVPPHRRLALAGVGVALLAGVAVIAVPLLPVPASVAAPASAAGGAPADAGATAGPLTPTSVPSPASLTAPAAPGTAGLANQSVDALSTRLRIWRVAAGIAERHPLGMFGYGGWHEQYAALAPAQGLNPGFPPHNWVIDAWSTVGLVGVVLEAALVAALAVLLLRRLRAGSRPRRLGLVLAGIALGWILLHGLADNTGFTGGPRLVPIVALAVGVLVVGAPVARPAARAIRTAVPV